MIKTIEEKAKAYDRALEKMKSWVRGEHPECFTEAQKAAEFIFPELKESEDERIRKELIDYHRSMAAQADDYVHEAWIAWLEKQSKKNSVTTEEEEKVREQVVYAINKLNVPESEKNKLLAWLEKQYADPIKEYWRGYNEGKQNVLDKYAELEKQGEQKSIDKVEPKFKVGDRITKSSKKSCPVHSSIDDTICEVAEVHDTCYILNTKEGRIQEPFEWQDYYELVEPAWSEEDEKIRKELIDYINRLTASPLYIDKYNAWITWLEKQEGCEYIKKDWLEHIKQSWYKEGFIDGKYTPKELTINDATTLNELIDFLENGTVKLQHDLTLYANWLKTQFFPKFKNIELNK